MNTSHVFDGSVADHIKSIIVSDIDITYNSDYPPYLEDAFYLKVKEGIEDISEVFTDTPPKEAKKIEIFAVGTDLKIAKKILALYSDLTLRVVSLVQLIESIKNSQKFLDQLSRNLTILYEDELYTERKTFAAILDRCRNLEEVNTLTIQLEMIREEEWNHVNELLKEFEKSSRTIPIYNIHVMLKTDVETYTGKYLSDYLASYKVNF